MVSERGQGHGLAGQCLAAALLLVHAAVTASSQDPMNDTVLKLMSTSAGVHGPITKLGSLPTFSWTRTVFKQLSYQGWDSIHRQLANQNKLGPRGGGE